MAIHHNASITPTKDELLAAWVPQQPWYDGPAGAALERPGSYRFDDPAGEVGVEVHLLRAGDGPWLQVPLTYRGAPLEGADAHLVCTMEHTTLGRRWVYDGCQDPVFAAVLAATVLGGGRQADLYLLEHDGSLTPEPPKAQVRGSGAAGGHPGTRTVRSVTLEGGVRVVEADGVTLRVPHVLGADLPTQDADTLTGTWPGQDEPVLLATASVSPAGS
jgi:hypothetical protein